LVDIREDILARLLEVAATIPNIRMAVRNDTDIPEDKYPAIIIYDGDETTGDADDASMRSANRPTAVAMTPEITIVNQSDDVGSDLTTWRRELIKRVLADTELNEQIVRTGRHGNGSIRYLGCQTHLGWMRSMYGALRVEFMFKYFLKPEEL
jgi:hypothetical protein